MYRLESNHRPQANKAGSRRSISTQVVGNEGSAWLQLVLGVICLTLPLWSCAAKSGYDSQDPFRRAIREGRLDDAQSLAEDALAKDPGDKAAQIKVRDTKVMHLLRRARELTFEEQPQAALDVLLAAQDLDPENPMVQVWVAKTRRHLADCWLEIANTYSGDADLDQAEIALRRALLYVPDDPQALHDLERVLVRSDYRKGLSVDYFYGGLSALNEERYQSADRDLGISEFYDQANEDATRRRKDVHHQLAQEGLATAFDLESQGLFFAASNEFRGVLFHEPGNAEAQAGVARLENEVRAELLLRSAEMMVLRGDFGDAQDELDQARALTKVQIERIEQFEGEIEAARWEAMYERAASYYQDHRLEDAVKLLDKLLAEVESYSDARETRDAIADDIAKAASLYDQALKSTDEETQLSLLKQVLVVRVEYKDVAERIAALEKKLADSDDAGSDDTVSDDPASDDPASDDPASDRPGSDKPGSADNGPMADQPSTGSDEGDAPR